MFGFSFCCFGGVGGLVVVGVGFGWFGVCGVWLSLWVAVSICSVVHVGGGVFRMCWPICMYVWASAACCSSDHLSGVCSGVGGVFISSFGNLSLLWWALFCNCYLRKSLVPWANVQLSPCGHLASSWNVLQRRVL